VEAGGCDEAATAAGDIDCIDALNLNTVLTDDAAPRLYGGERTGRAGGVFDEEEGDGLAVGRPGGLLEVAGEVGELADIAGGAGPEKDLGLVGLVLGGGAGGEEG
jgi:hypothetical protein